MIPSKAFHPDSMDDDVIASLPAQRGEAGAGLQ
jgi:hypothetical protein